MTGVFLDGPGWSDSFNAGLAERREGSADFGYAVGGFHFQERVVPWLGASRVGVRFDRQVEVDADDLRVIGSDGSTRALNIAPGAFAYDAATRSATWTLAEPPGADTVTLRLDGNGSGVRTPDPDGVALDGEWRHPVIDGTVGMWLPSGDGYAGGDFEYRMNLLPGDATRDGVVNSLDVAEVRRRLNTAATTHPPPDWPPGHYTPFADVTADGRINSLDLAAVKQRLNSRLPAGPPAPAPAALAAPPPLRLSATRDFFGAAPALL